MNKNRSIIARAIWVSLLRLRHLGSKYSTHRHLTNKRQVPTLKTPHLSSYLVPHCKPSSSNVQLPPQRSHPLALGHHPTRPLDSLLPPSLAHIGRLLRRQRYLQHSHSCPCEPYCCSHPSYRIFGRNPACPRL